MKPLAAILIALALPRCVPLEGNGITLGVNWTDPNTGAQVEISTAK